MYNTVLFVLSPHEDIYRAFCNSNFATLLFNVALKLTEVISLNKNDRVIRIIDFFFFFGALAEHGILYRLLALNFARNMCVIDEIIVLYLVVRRF